MRWFKANHPIRVADKVLNEHFAGTYDAFVVLSYNDADAVGNYIDAGNQLLENMDAAVAADLRERLNADSSETDAYYDSLIAATDDALFDASDSASIDALEQLMLLTEEAQSASKYFQRPDILHEIVGIQQALDASGFVGKTNALPDVVKVVNRELRDGQDSNYSIPDSVPGVAQTLLQYQSSHRPQDLWHMVTPDFSSTAIWLQLKSGDNQDMARVINALDDYISDNPLPAGVELRWAGKTYINVVWQDAMVNGMLNSLVGAFVVVFLMMAFLFRSARLGRACDGAALDNHYRRIRHDRLDRQGLRYADCGAFVINPGTVGRLRDSLHRTNPRHAQEQRQLRCNCEIDFRGTGTRHCAQCDRHRAWLHTTVFCAIDALYHRWRVHGSDHGFVRNFNAGRATRLDVMGGPVAVSRNA